MYSRLCTNISNMSFKKFQGYSALAHWTGDQEMRNCNMSCNRNPVPVYGETSVVEPNWAKSQCLLNITQRFDRFHPFWSLAPEFICALVLIQQWPGNGNTAECWSHFSHFSPHSVTLALIWRIASRIELLSGFLSLHFFHFSFHGLNLFPHTWSKERVHVTWQDENWVWEKLVSFGKYVKHSLIHIVPNHSGLLGQGSIIGFRTEIVCPTVQVQSCRRNK